MFRRTATASALVLLALGATAACSTGGPSTTPSQTVTVTVPAPSDSPAGTSSASTSSAGTSSQTPTASDLPTSTPTGPRSTLAGSCDSRLPLGAVNAALGRPVAGETSFVIGTAEPDIGRLTYWNCRYGLGPGGTGTPAVEIGISLYATPAAATARIPATVNDYQANGATASSTTVNGQQATILTGGSGAGYTSATIVLAADQRTVAVSIAASATTPETTNADLVKLAAAALARTAN